MSSYLIGSLVGGGFVLAGSLLTMVRESRVRKAEHRAARRAELKSAMREYLAALDAVAIEIADSPATPRPTRVDAFLDWLADRTGFSVILFILIRLLRRATHGGRHDELSDRLVAASAHLRLIAPVGILDLMREIEDTAERYEPASGRWSGEWKVLRIRVRAAFRAELGEARRGA